MRPNLCFDPRPFSFAPSKSTALPQIGYSFKWKYWLNLHNQTMVAEGLYHQNEKLKFPLTELTMKYPKVSFELFNFRDIHVRGCIQEGLLMD